MGEPSPRGVLPSLDRIREWRKERRARRIAQRLIRPTDTFLVGHPKSGNTWLAYMLTVLATNDRQGRVTLANLGDFAPAVHWTSRRLRHHHRLPDPRIFRDEWPRFPDLHPRTVYLVRDPRATLVSLFHMYRAVFDYPASPKEFVAEYLEHGRIARYEPRLERWDRHVMRWFRRRRNGDRVHIVRYENLVRARRATLAAAAKFIGIPSEPERLDFAVSRGGFDAMRDLEKKHGVESYPGEIGRRNRFVRRGQIDGWRDELDSTLARRITREFEPVMQLAGYDTSLPDPQ